MAMKVYDPPGETGNSSLRKLVAKVLGDMDISAYRPYVDHWPGYGEGPDVFEITDEEGRRVSIQGGDLTELIMDCRDEIRSIGWKIAEGDEYDEREKRIERCIGRAIVACRCYHRLKDAVRLMTDKYVSEEKDPPYAGASQRQFA